MSESNDLLESSLGAMFKMKKTLCLWPPEIFYIFLKKRLKFFFDKFACMLYGFPAVFCSEAINPDWSNNNTNGNTMSKGLYRGPGRGDPAWKKAVVSYLTILDKCDLSHISTHLSTRDFVWTQCPRALAPYLPPTHWVTLDKSLSLSEP